ncbi:MAG: molybdopterin-dependent oxidoreductase [Bacteroidales bacterium]|jgi:isoquinoline 1-oxidoreductase|nr:molybdopterin-dependent oxidoreductase [Bacteroidales bacterium]
MKKSDDKKTVKRQGPAGTGLPRRDFFKLLGAGIIVFFRPWGELDLLGLPAEQARTLTKDYNAFLSIAEDGTVTMFTGKMEMGQGIITSLPVQMAEELNVPLDKVKIILGDTDLCPYDAGTWGSLTTRQFGPSMRAAAAEAKGVLLDLAAAQFGIPASQLEVKDGVITDTTNPANKVTYGALAKGKRIEKYLDVKPQAEDFTKFNLVGKPYMHVDAVDKVMGKAVYTGDMKLPGMVYARILRPPSHGAKLSKVDYSEAEKIKGVQVVRDGDFIGVLHESFHVASLALDKIRAEYTFNEMPVNDKTIFEWILKADSRANVVRTSGDLEEGRKSSEKIFESEFHDPYLAHAPIETHTALARFTDGKLTVWAATQSPFGLQDSLVREFGMTHDKVRVITPFVGGGFGGKSKYQQGNEAARLAKLSGKPVMLVWTRDEEFFYDNFHAASVIKISSGIDKEGFIKFWDYHVHYAGTRGSETTYNVPNAKTTDYSRNKNAPAVHPFDTGPWRAPNNNTNTFAREVQVDIMAAAAGIDPLEFRLKNLTDQKMIDCLKAVAEKFGYKPAKGPSGRGIGIACGSDAGTWVAEIAEVKVDRNTGKVEVLRVACAQDMGLCVNPQGSLIQMEGCITMGLGYTFAEELVFEGGNIRDRGFDTYQIPRFSWLPGKIENVILDRKDKAPQGGGEPAIIAVGAAVANAIFDATGARLYRMPMTPARVLEALKKV